MFIKFDERWFSETFGSVRSMAIIGNAPTLLHTSYSNLIDSCDVVCRFNQFKIKGYEQYVGSKTNFYGCNMISYNSLEFLLEAKVQGVLATRPISTKHCYNVALGDMLSTFEQLKTLNVSFVPEKIFEQLYEQLGISQDDRSGHNPSSGLTVLYAATRLLNLQQIYLIGFNFFDIASDVHYFPSNTHEKVTLEQLNSIYHPPVKEKPVFRSIIETSQNIYITDDEAQSLGITNVKTINHMRT